MPVTSIAQQSWPAWSELTHVDVIRIEPNEIARLDRTDVRCRIVICEGTLETDGARHVRGEVVDLPVSEESTFELMAGNTNCTVTVLHGRWGNETGGCGLFNFDPSASPENRGTPADYERHTRFDNHYHDCDEYWLFLEGEIVAVSEGTFYHVGPGDCVITGAGDHHDIADVGRTGQAVFFETTLIGQKRRGHLWEQTHGTAAPRRR